MSDLAARLDEDEAAAAACQSPSPWKAADNQWSDSWIVTDGVGEPLIFDEGTPSLEEAIHIARHDPGRVLREVAAKRAIIALCETETDETGGRPLAVRILNLLAGVYSNDPDKGNER